MSDGLTFLVITLTIFPDLSKTVKTTAATRRFPAFGAKEILPLKKSSPEVMMGLVSATVDNGNPPSEVLVSFTEDVDVSVFMVMGVALDVGDVFPAVSVMVEEMFQVPSDSAGKVQLVADPTT